MWGREEGASFSIFGSTTNYALFHFVSPNLLYVASHLRCHIYSYSCSFFILCPLASLVFAPRFFFFFFDDNVHTANSYSDTFRALLEQKKLLIISVAGTSLHIQQQQRRWRFDLGEWLRRIP